MSDQSRRPTRAEAGLQRRRRARLAFQKLGGRRLFGSEANFVRSLPAGVPIEALSELQKIFSPEELDELVTRGRALSHPTSRNRPLNEQESGRAVRVAFLTSLAEEVFADDERAHFWLRTPVAVLRGRRPIDFSESEEGADLVEQILYRIAHGISA
jgi:putative toxin-antitoxin system antitoxin component (TIGR02293 family)